MLKALRIQMVKAATECEPNGRGKDDGDGDTGTNNLCRGYARKLWSRVRYLLFRLGGGRVPCLNYGATMANGYILTFCHMYTIMPTGWDTHIKSELDIDKKKDGDDSNYNTAACINCRVFWFGIDTSFEGLCGSSAPTSTTTIDN